MSIYTSRRVGLSRHGTTTTAALRPGSMSLIEYHHLRFLITDCPSEDTIHHYLRDLLSYNTTDVVRVCEESYPSSVLTTNDINVHEWKFEDGGVPTRDIVQKFIALVFRRFGRSSSCHYLTSPRSTSLSTDSSGGSGESQGREVPAIAVHCVAGIGRAPVLVALALIEFGMDPLDAVAYVRQRRAGTFNTKQIQFLEKYKKVGRPPMAVFRAGLSKLFRSRSDSPAPTIGSDD